MVCLKVVTVRFSSRPRAKVKHQGLLGAVTV